MVKIQDHGINFVKSTEHGTLYGETGTVYHDLGKGGVRWDPSPVGADSYSEYQTSVSAGKGGDHRFTLHYLFHFVVDANDIVRIEVVHENIECE